MRVLVVGAGGMLGHVVYTELKKNHEVLGTVRRERWIPELLSNFHVEDISAFDQLIKEFRPEFIINCVGIIKQKNESKEKLLSIQTNALWPHQLAQLAALYGSKLIHFSTDCVFSGQQGNYSITDIADARDVYGLTKYLGEVDYPHALTLRTSIIGHELSSNVSLIDWFLSQKNNCKGFSGAIYSGFPTIFVAKFLEEVIFKKFISGVYHFSAEPINKYELLKLVAQEYEKEIEIIPDNQLQLDRSLNSDPLRKALDFTPPSWNELIQMMYKHYTQSNLYKAYKES